MYYVAHGRDAVDVPWQVDVIIDGGAPISFNPFDISATANISAIGRTGDARMSTIDLTGQSGQIIVLDFYSDGRTDLAGGGSQSCCGGEWTGLNEIVFVPEPATATMALLGLGGLFVRRRRRH
jgi:MYXO-CTERM domain-containing protein